MRLELIKTGDQCQEFVWEPELADIEATFGFIRDTARAVRTGTLPLYDLSTIERCAESYRLMLQRMRIKQECSIKARIQRLLPRVRRNGNE